MRTLSYVAAALALAAGCRTSDSSLVAAPVSGADLVAPSFPREFWGLWSDGNAELAGYDLVSPRYGEVRSGYAVTIFVKESFEPKLRVKADAPNKSSVTVMKLNLVQDFQTGIYDYNLMTSAFVALVPTNGRPAGTTYKVAFSNQEWCGMTYHHLLFDDKGIRETVHSYFDGEADQENEIAYPQDGISEDALLLWARGMAAPALAPGAEAKVRVLTSLQRSRFAHVPLAWTSATLSRSKDTQEITVPAGTFQVEKLIAQLEGGPTYTFWVEPSGARRLIKWEDNQGLSASLLASDRLPYWKLHDEGQESYLSKLGLSRRPPRTP
jgi:hypothetical protein